MVVCISKNSMLRLNIQRNNTGAAKWFDPPSNNILW